MNEQNEGARFATEIEQVVRATLDRQAASVPLQDPPVSLLLERGRKRRRRRDALSVTGALAMVFAGVVGVHAAIASPGGPAAAKQVIVAASGRPSVGASASAVGGYQAQVPTNWKPGAKLPLGTYSSVPSWAQVRDAATELGGDKDKDHHVQPEVGTGASVCLTLGSTPLVWPKGFYAEGTPLVVFDPKGRPVYVVDQGFTGVDGPAKLGFGDGLRLLPGLDLSHCGAEATSELEPYAIAMIFADTPRQ
ncbi:hypothetical protein KDL01_20600 [Actinospica durhamensis]|uniref:Uncharacterized protein n=1 Tax=Actinospica durhamensis TaxID=1508375 RepID=A0A941ER82_9ACTN|nr:hypothetical protein [Actinospica durhamensis]MBR7835688.1 hypothetical protein [Actinospica durhamensis]